MSTMTITPSSIRTTQRVTRPAARPAVRPAQGQVRLTRRGQVVVVLFLLVAVLALGVFWGGGSVATERPGTPEPTTIVTVESGDTLYAIAAEVTTDGDVAAMVERIQRLNALDSGMLQAGQKIRVPLAE